jgi:hypothetical protein
MTRQASADRALGARSGRLDAEQASALGSPIHGHHDVVGRVLAAGHRGRDSLVAGVTRGPQSASDDRANSLSALIGKRITVFAYRILRSARDLANDVSITVRHAGKWSIHFAFRCAPRAAASRMLIP